MTFKIFSPPDGIKSWSALYIGQLPQVLSFEGGVPFRGYDDFELVIPYDDYFAAHSRRSSPCGSAPRYTGTVTPAPVA